MSNNIFQFGDTHWRQKQGCAMGTSTAVNYAYLYVGILEIQTLLKKYGAQLLFFKRFIDDVIGVWLPDPNKPDTWERFFDDLNSFGRLRWTCDGLTNELIFMDLRIMLLPNGNLHFTTYQKEMNLYLYIPPGSAHPRSMLRGLVFGRLRAYALHNTDRADFMHFAELLAKRLSDRGLPTPILLPVFKEALNHLKHQSPRARQHPTPEQTRGHDQSRIFFHLPFHPRGLQRKQVRWLFEQHMGPVLPNCKLTVAVSRPLNLRYRVCSTVLPDVPGNNPSDFLPGGDRALPASFA